MRIETNIDKWLHKELIKIRDSKTFINFIFNYCESQEERARILLYIRNGNNDRKQVLLMASQIAIENGTSEGELEDE